MTTPATRTHYCGTLGKEHIGQEVHLQGWVNRRRDLGGLIFIDVRDRSGLVQTVFNPEYQEALALAEKLRPEYVVSIHGTVTERAEETINPKIATGEIEVMVHEAEVINAAKTPPFPVQDDVDVDESVRLRHRYIDLRRPEMQRSFRLRHQAAKLFRDFWDEHDFLEIETPMLTRSTPEGARDYLVPSRVHPGEFFALPQSPQLFKQLLMVSGMERYFQIVRCFRDEDLRADRQPEFTQVDVEASFLSMDELHGMVEKLMVRLFREVLGEEIPLPFPKLTYAEAMDRFGSDKPDLRFGMELINISDLAAKSEFKVFSTAVANGGQVKGLNVKGCAHYSRKDIDRLTEYVQRYGAKGLAWLALRDEGSKGSMAKFYQGEDLEALQEAMQAEEGDLLLFVADQSVVVDNALGNLRLKLGHELDLVPEHQFRFCWVTDFPLMEYDKEQGRHVALHHPFTMPMEEDLHIMDTEPEKVRAQAYDLVLNGYEIAGGSMRIYQRDIQEKMFALLGFSVEEAREKFGFLLEAFEYGTPPHGGIAFGFDRIVMLLAGRHNLREVIAFPKTANANCLLTNAPSSVEQKQLEELQLRSMVPPKETVTSKKE